MDDSDYKDYHKPSGRHVYESPVGETSKELVSWEHILGSMRPGFLAMECFDCCIGGKLAQVNETHVCGFVDIYFSPYKNCTDAVPMGRFGVSANISGMFSTDHNTFITIPNCYATFSNVIIAQPFKKIGSLSSHSYNISWSLSLLIFFCILLIQKRT
ncbi:hypothetical protein BJV82DRAFT_625164 [Fennellomyces sp. T-0311]|nr:hypothetical protein BJV82DRAFT_625164 [Fennellomyces sp. T-0311]